MGDFAFSAAIGQFISRGLTEAQSPKIEKKCRSILKYIWSEKLNIAKGSETSSVFNQGILILFAFWVRKLAFSKGLGIAIPKPGSGWSGSFIGEWMARPIPGRQGGGRRRESQQDDTTIFFMWNTFV